MNQERGWLYGLSLTLATVACWGVLPVALKALLVYMDAWTITWYRFLAAALVLGAWLGATGGLPRPRQLGGTAAILLAVASLGLIGNYVLYLVGLDHVQPGTAQVVIQLAPMFLLLGGLLVFREPFRARQWLGVAVLVGGLLLFFHDRLALLTTPAEGEGRGVFLIILAAVTWAAYGLAQKGLGRRLSPSHVLLVIYVAAVPLLLPTARPGALFEQGGVALALLAFASVNTLIAYGCFAEAIKAWEASRVSAVLAVTPLATLATVAVTHRFVPDHVPADPVDALSLFGALLVVAGSATAALGGARRRSPA